MASFRSLRQKFSLPRKCCGFDPARLRSKQFQLAVVDFQRNALLNQPHGDDDSRLSAARHHVSLDAFEGTAFDAHSIALLEPALHRQWGVELDEPVNLPQIPAQFLLL